MVVINPTSNSRLHSPMEISTRSSSLPSEVQHSEPAVIGAWPASRPQSPTSPTIDGEPQKIEPPTNFEPRDDGTSTDHVGESDPLSDSLPHELINLRPPLFFPVGGPFSDSISADFGCNPSVPSSSADRHPIDGKLPEHAMNELRAAIKNAEERVVSLQETVADVKSRQCLAEDDIMDLQTHVDMLEPESDQLLSRINLAERNIASLSSLQSQVNTLCNRLDAPEPRTLDAPLSDVKACADALKALVSEMKVLRQDAEKRIDEKIDAISVARNEALSAITVEVESLKSLKRKRCDDDDDSQYSRDNMKAAVTVENSRTSPEVIRRPKRAKTAVYTAARTAAAMAVGAIATWSALAFA
ncbi:hypothetical protein F5I97DRAFT_1046410 [Phlebopus sp. FC_14]|nr:hypothetical protein F5I97DRAFT_1046410 [Phlebopus sp. FC_14]